MKEYHPVDIFAKFLARQIRNPSQGIGQFVLAPLWNKRNVVLNDLMYRMLDLHPQDRVLEIGFGGGYLLSKIRDGLADGFIAGIDASSAMVDFCKNRYQTNIQGNTLDLKTAIAEDIPYPSAHFTKVCSVNSLFYWDDVSKAFSEIRRVLRKGGTFVLCFTDKSSLETKRFAQYGLNLFEIEEIHRLVSNAGFTAVDATSHTDRYRTFWCVAANA